MSQILSQEEVDALLEGVSNGEIKTKQEEVYDPSEARLYDLTSQGRIVRGRMPTLEIMAEKFGRIFRASLLSSLRKFIDINTTSVEIVKYGDFIKSIPLPASFNIFKMQPLKGLSLLIVEAQVIFSLLDIVFGGSGKKGFRIEGRDFTPIENNLIKKIVLSALSDFESVWESVIKLDIIYQRAETNPQFIQFMVHSDVVIVVQFEIDMEFSSGIISFCIPYSTIEPIGEKLRGGYQADSLEVDKAWTNRFLDGLRHSNVNLVVELGRTEMIGREVANLKKGDVIPLEQYCTDSLDVYVEDILKFKGQPGIYRGSLAVEVSKLIVGREV